MLNENKFLLLRLFEKESHAKEFLSGKIRMMSLSYYRKMENDNHGRQDKFEGAQKLWQGNNTVIRAGNMIITGADGLDSVLLRLNDYEENTKISCCTLLPMDADPSINEKNLLQFGLPYCVIFKDPNEFLSRFRNVAKGMECYTGKVSFFDPHTYNGDINFFNKPDLFSWQNEYRMKVYVKSDDPFYLDVGDINDIANMFKTEDLVKMLFHTN